MTLNIRVGGRYRTRGGEEVEIFGFNPSWVRFPYEGHMRREGSASLTWSAQGRFVSGDSPHPLDLVSEITEPTAGERLVRAAKEAVAIARGEAQPAAVHTYIVSGGFAERIRSGCPDTVGDEFFAMTVEGEAKPAATHRHKKRGTEYVLVGYGRMQAGDWYRYDGAGEYSLADDEEVAIYRGVTDGKLWVRPREEFEDGRFELISDAMIAEGSKGDD